MRVWKPEEEIEPLAVFLFFPPQNLDSKTSHRGFDLISECLFFYSFLASCVDFNATLTAVSLCLRSELSGICGRCFTRGVTKRGAPFLVWRDRAERFTPRLSGGNICVLANGRRPLGRRGNRLPAAVRGDGPCRGPSEERDGDEGEEQGRR